MVVWLVRSIGLGDILAVVRHLGVGGFLLVCAASLGLFLLLGAAWQAAAGEPARTVPLFAYARMVREAAADFLPLSQIGGLAAGARIARIGGMPRARLYASMIVDQATEMASQVVFSIAGVSAAIALLSGGGERGSLRLSIVAASGALVLMLVALVAGQRRFLRFASALAHRLLPSVSALLAETEAELARLYTRRGRVLASFLWNLAAWLAMAGVAWLILRLIGTPLSAWRVVAIESAIAVVRSAAFLVPGALGLQEAAYAAVGPLFGLPIEAAVALSLIKRGRDAALALAGLLGWQTIEIGLLARRRRRTGDEDAASGGGS